MSNRTYRIAKAVSAFFGPNPMPEASYSAEFGMDEVAWARVMEAYQRSGDLIDGCLAEVHAKEEQIDALQANLAKLQAENIALQAKPAPPSQFDALDHWPVVREMWDFSNGRYGEIDLASHLVDRLGLDRVSANFYADTYKSAEGLIGACCAEIDRMREAAEEEPQESLESPSLTHDGEIETIAEIWEMLQDLADEEARDRVLRYLGERCGIALS